MPTIHVSPLSKIHEVVSATGARSLVTLLRSSVEVERPAAIAPERHLVIAVSDIIEPMEGHILPHDGHVGDLLDFALGWDRREPMLIHCFAGVSRSTAAAFITVCALAPDQSEAEIAQRLRRASPTATPNAKLVEIADIRLGRQGRMVAAVQSIGRGIACIEGTAFELPLA